ncbi:MAG TPA: DUF3352 domain-containing protein [Candidatus Limnocylindrales bacterium]|nr:DUF3352 domain-containing protein [Candidatus Limnocylindrales bacterium]
MTESRTPDDPGLEPTGAEPSPSEAAGTPNSDAASGDSPTQPWPSLTPSMDTAPSAASWSSPAAATPPPVPDAPTYEPTEPLPDTRLGTVAETGTFGASAGAVAVQDAPRSRSGLRWGLALLGVLIVLGASALIVFLAGGRPATSLGMGYMPATTAQYTEVRLDLPGDQRPKLAAFLANFPGFKDQTQVEPKLNDVFDRIVRAASDGKQTYTTDIAPWFGGQISVGAGVPDPAAASGLMTPLVTGMNSADSMLVVIGIKDQAKAASWLAALLPSGSAKETYNGADIWTASSPSSGSAVAITDKVMLLGSVAGVHAAIDSKGQGSLGNDADFKAAYAQVDKDYVVLSVIRIRPYVDAVTKVVERASPGVLSGTQLDETVLAMIPAWQLTTARFESDEFVSTTVYPSFAIGFDATNHKSTLLDHAPANSLLFTEWHDVGQGLTAVLSRFRALPETKAAFQAFDQALNLLGGFSAVVGWWGDTAFLVTPGADGVIGGGLVIQPRDKAAADHLFTTLRAYLTLAGASAGVNVRDEDHNGTKISILDFSAAPGMTPGSLPPGYKAEFAFAVTNDVAVLGYGRDFVAAVLDAKPGSNLASDDRFKKLVTRVGEENMALAFLDVNAIRGLIEPIIQQTAPEAWTSYQTDIKPYFEHLDALISALRKDGGLDRGDGGLTLR